MEELRQKLVELAETHVSEVDRELPTRLPVDRVFHLKGLGVIATGTLAAGAAHPGDSFDLLPTTKAVRVRSVQVHGEGREEALAGERTSLQLTGVELPELHRGMQLVSPGAFRSSNRLLARFQLLSDAPSALSGWTPVRLHLYSSEVLGTLRPLRRESSRDGGDDERPAHVFEPGDAGLVELKLAAPVVAIRGDRYIVRRPSPALTLGGGEILAPEWRRPKGRFLAPALEALAGDPRQAILYWISAAGEKGLSDGEVAQYLGITRDRLAADLAALADEQKILEIPSGQGRERRWIAPITYERITERARRVLKLYFKNDRLARGIPKAEAVKRILPGRAGELASVYFDWLEKQRVVVIQEGLVTLPGRSVELTGEESELSRSVLRLFQDAGLTPPSPSEAQAALQAKPQILEGVIRYQVQRGQLIRLPGGLILAASAVERMRSDLEATGWDRFSVAQFKDRFDLSRKWAIPLLEHLDSIGATRRLGDERMLVRVSAT
jgi:selenocysteine-specific elongation factor